MSNGSTSVSASITKVSVTLWSGMSTSVIYGANLACGTSMVAFVTEPGAGTTQLAFPTSGCCASNRYSERP